MKISQVLRETSITQVTGDLIKFKFIEDEDDDIGIGHYIDEMIGKCAMGVLACESDNQLIHLSYMKRSVPYDVILASYGIDDEMIYPRIKYPTHENDIPLWDWEYCDMRLSNIIIRLNDKYGFNFKQIADFLEVTFDL